MKKITLLIALLLFVVTGSYAQASLYTFAQSSGTYVPITGGTVVTSATSVPGTLNPLDSYVSLLQTFPVPFKFAGTNYSNFYVTSNGQISFGPSAPSSYSYRPLSTSFANDVVIAPFSADLSVANLATGEIRWEQVGSELVVQWTNFRRYNKAETFNFQARLNTSTGNIVFVYDGTGPYAATTDYQPQVGLKSFTGAGGYVALTVGSAGSWNAPSAITTGVADSSIATFNGAVGFASGQTYTFTPTPGCGPAALVGGTITTAATAPLCSGATTPTISVTGVSPAYANVVFQWEQSTNNGTTWTNIVGGSQINTSTYALPVFGGAAIQYRLKTSCSGTDVYSTVYTINPTTAPITQSSAMVQGNSGFTSMTLSWTNGDGGRRVVYFSTAPITNPVSGTAIPAYTAATAYTTGQQLVYEGTGSSVTVTGLTCGTTYYAKVFDYNRCGSGPYDVYFNTSTGTNGLTLVTPSIAAALPNSNSFSGFTGSNMNTASTGWFEAAITTTAGATPTTANPAGLTSSWTSSTVFAGVTTAKVNLLSNTKNEWIISPKLAITAGSRVKFRAAITDTSSSAADPAGMQGTDDKVVVMITTDCGATWAPLYTFSAANTTALTNALTDFSVAIPSSYNGQTVQIGFQATEGPTDDTPSYDFHLANIIIELVPACDKPILTAATNITKNSATINWNVPLAGVPTGYQYVVSATNTAPTGAGTSASGTSANVASLAPSTQYYVFMRTACGSDFSDWTASGTFTTLCNYGDISGTAPVTRCGVGPVTMNAVTTDGTIKWYENATGGTAVGTGSPYTANVTADKTFYVAAESLGATLPSGVVAPGSDWTTSTTSNWGIIFNASATTLINSVDVYSTSAGTLDVKIVNSAGTELFATGSVAVANGGTATPTTIPLNFTVPAGTGYKILIKSFSGVALVRGNSGLAFPYTNGNISVTSSEWGGATTGNYYYFFNIKTTFICASPRVAVQATVSAPPALTLSAAPAAVCSGQSTSVVTITSNPADFNNYVWTPSEGVSGNQSTGWTFNPSVSTIYTLNANQTSGSLCTNSASINISINPLPSTLVLADATACEGFPVTLTPTGGTVPSVILTENFNAATNNWTTGNASTGGTVNNAAWTLRPDAYVYLTYGTWHSNDNSQFYHTNSDAQGTGGTTSTTLVSPAFSTLGYTSAAVSFYHYFYDNSATSSTGKVEVSLNGTDWATLETYTGIQGTVGGFALGTVNLTGTYLNQPTVYVRFKFNGSYRYFWGIDNVTIAGNKSTSFTWSPVTGLYTDAAATVAYSGGPAATVYAKPTATTTYTVTATSQVGCITTDTAVLTFSSTPAPTVAAATQTICNAGTVADLTATGTDVKWYAAATGGTALTATTALVNGNQYFASQTLNNCESFARTAKTVSINVVAAPTVADNTPEFCNAATVANLQVNGSGIKWYAAAAGGTEIAGTTALVSGTPYYASQTINGCEGLVRTEVTPTINVTPTPTVDAATQTLCNAGTVADLTAVGTGIKWYSALTGGNELVATDALVSGTVYFASQTINGCESIGRVEKTAVINVVVAPTVDTATQTFCNAGTVAELTVTGTDVKWYDAETAGNLLDAAAALVDGTIYYASQTIDGCEGTARVAKTAIVNIVAAPSADDEQEFCDAAIVDSLVANGTGIQWYDAETGGNLLTGDIDLVNGNVYYASQTIDGCEGLTRIAVTAVIHNVVVDTPADVNVCSSYELPALTNGAYFTEPEGAGTELAAGTAITETTTLYVYAQAGTDVVCFDESSFTVTVANIPAPSGEATQSVSVSQASEATIDDLVVDASEEGTIVWYSTAEDAAAGTNPLASGTVITNGSTYYAVQIVGECSSPAFAVTVTVVLGRDHFDAKALSVYPNPVKDILNISYSSDITSVSVFNMLGQQVMVLAPEAASVKLDMSSLADAPYIINVTVGNTVKTVKVVKKQ